jgi:hypothetical protein
MLDATHVALHGRSPVRQLALLLAQELAKYAPRGVDPVGWAWDRAANMAAWASDPETTTGDVHTCLSKGTLRTGETVAGLPVHPRAVGAVVRCVNGLEGE